MHTSRRGVSPGTRYGRAAAVCLDGQLYIGRISVDVADPLSAAYSLPAVVVHKTEMQVDHLTAARKKRFRAAALFQYVLIIKK